MTDAGQLPDLTQTFAEMARTFFAAKSVDETLRRVVDCAVETVDGCDYAGVSIVQRGGEITTPAASHLVPARCDALQYDVGEGPCLSAIWDRQTFESEDLSQEQRWPRWTPHALELGVASLISLRLFVDENTLGALNLYSSAPGGFNDADRDHAVILAAHAAVALTGAQRQADMDAAIVIAKATGMLMERQNISSPEALKMLARAAQRMNVRLQVVAERVVNRRGPAP